MPPHALLAAALILTPLSIAEPEWYRVGEGPQRRIYIDRASIETNGQWTRAQEWAEYREISAKTGVKRVRVTHDVDCQARKFRLVRLVAVDANGKVLHDRDWGDKGELRELTPDTLWADMGDFVCGNDRSRAVRVSDPMTDTD